ncbi:hypothetical protein [Sediminitomix flava]|uniref:Uncharacterized protein n=1 Tax=Sediminitomix flava TaxID=379075 RepID=A0A315ZGI3_SEDFL|nr:hypothetical protein [Sediminitomix flava]PWJ43968.1 hypothetical protein BC781_101318 [Sediminitomix flava]
MKRVLFLAFVYSLFSYSALAQINMNDSSAQVIGYWDMNEKQSYTITEEKYKIRDADTTNREFIKYSVDVTIVDSTANSYDIEWLYKDFDIDTEDEFSKKLISISENMVIKIRTDEMGSLQHVLNWKEVQKYISKSLKLLKKEFKKQIKDAPNMDQIFRQVANMYATKEAIEAGAIKEILQFYTFHGARYELGEEYKGDMKTANLLGGEPFDTHMSVSLDELNPEDNNYIIRMKSSVDSQQLTDATFNYLTQMTASLNVSNLKREDFPNLSNDTWTASRIHGSGWVIYTIETKEVFAEGRTNVEERIIEIQ